MEKYKILSIFGVIGSFISNCLGGWTTAMTTLIIFMIIDYVSGFAVAALFKKSRKTKNGALESGVGYKGLMKKGGMLFMVLVGVRLDIEFGSNFIRNAVIISFITNELVSIIENVGLMGVKLPPIFNEAIEILKKKSNEKFEIKTEEETK